MSSSQNPSYFAIIPANIRYDKNLCPNSKLLFGELTALSNKFGYCWASNKYFADLYDVDERTISRWLESLKQSNYIEIITEKNGMSWDRKIYLRNVYEGTKLSGSNGHKEMFTKGQNCQDRYDKNVPILVQSLDIKEQQQAPDGENVAVVVPSFEEKKNECERLLCEAGLPEASVRSILKLNPTAEAITASLTLAKSSEYDDLGGWLTSCLKNKWWANKQASKAETKKQDDAKQTELFNNRKEAAWKLQRKMKDRIVVREKHIEVLLPNDHWHPIGIMDEEFDKFLEAMEK